VWCFAFSHTFTFELIPQSRDRPVGSLGDSTANNSEVSRKSEIRRSFTKHVKKTDIVMYGIKRRELSRALSSGTNNS